MRNALRWAVLVSADVAVLVALAPGAGMVRRRLGGLTGWLRRDTDGALAHLAGAALWCVCLWLALALLVVPLASCPGTVGRAGDALLRRLAPAALRRLLAGTIGLGVLLAPALANATTPTPPPRPDSAATGSPGWPTDPPAAPAWPSTPAPAAAPPATVTVQAGDSLWLIAARRLGPDADPGRTAAEWPRWYAANRSVVGPDPDLIRPGEVLHAPVPGR